LVVDLDVHQGDGTADILAGDPRVFTFSMHGDRNYPVRKIASDLDIALPDGTGDAAYLDRLEDILPRLGEGGPWDIVFYNAGVDVHAEATSDKQLLGRYLDGRVSAVLGTHTHVATADEQVLSGGTAFQCDVGMTGPHDGILGRRYDRVLSATLTQVPSYFDVSTGAPRLNGSLVAVNP
ncbi:MAG: YmdB family metallophosphoesterase, partial [Mesorhizobium sp.]|nr:YmdB family metallophosphoesterase [Mesorhizobium sp.]